MRIPTCLTLNAEQREKLDRFFIFLDEEPDDIEEQITPTGPVFHTYGTGIGDVLYVESNGQQCHLEYDDDGELTVDVWETLL